MARHEWSEKSQAGIARVTRSDSLVTSQFDQVRRAKPLRQDSRAAGPSGGRLPCPDEGRAGRSIESVEKAGMHDANVDASAVTIDEQHAASLACTASTFHRRPAWAVKTYARLASRGNHAEVLSGHGAGHGADW